MDQLCSIKFIPILWFEESFQTNRASLSYIHTHTENRKKNILEKRAFPHWFKLFIEQKFHCQCIPVMLETYFCLTRFLGLRLDHGSDACNAFQPRLVICRSHVNAWQIWCRTFDAVRNGSSQFPSSVGSLHYQRATRITLKNAHAHTRKKKKTQKWTWKLHHRKLCGQRVAYTGGYIPTWCNPSNKSSFCVRLFVWCYVVWALFFSSSCLFCATRFSTSME